MLLSKENAYCIFWEEHLLQVYKHQKENRPVMYWQKRPYLSWRNNTWRRSFVSSIDSSLPSCGWRRGMSCDACPSCFINPSVATWSTPGKAWRFDAIDDGRCVVMNADASWAARHDNATMTIASFIIMIAEELTPQWARQFLPTNSFGDRPGAGAS